MKIKFLIPFSIKTIVVLVSYAVALICLSCDSIQYSPPPISVLNNDTIHLTNTNTPSKEKPIQKDTIHTSNKKELLGLLRSNRFIKLGNTEIILDTTLNINSFQNLSIQGSDNTNISIKGNSMPVINISNASNIMLDSFQLGTGKVHGYYKKHGILRIETSDSITISNTKIIGTGTFGLLILDVNHLNFIKSEITKCSSLIFELSNSRYCHFENSIFHQNNLVISVLGGFTDNSREIRFLNCKFIDNKPEIDSNPAFNFWDNTEPKVVDFERCIFKNNKGFKWYGDQINLVDCKMDSLSF